MTAALQSPAPLPRAKAIYSWSDIKRMVEVEEKVVFVFKDGVYDVSKWLERHPGGSLALRHMNGKDATDHMRVFHPQQVVKQRLPYFRIGSLHQDCLHTPPPLIVDPKLYLSEEHYDASPIKPVIDNPDMVPTQHATHTMNHPKGVPTETQEFIQHTEKVLAAYRALDVKLREQGLYKADMSFYYRAMARFAAMYAGVWLLVVRVAPAWTASYGSLAGAAANLMAAVLLGLLWHQGAFVAHDAGHISVTGDYDKDWYLGCFLGNIVGGISIGWWKKSHNVHHIITNHPEHDPDIQYIPLFAITVDYCRNLYSSFHNKVMEYDAVSRALISVQHYLYYPVLCVARFNLYVQSFIYLASSNPDHKFRRTEFLGLVVFWIWFSTLLSFIPSWPVTVAFLLLSHATTFILHLQITLSHFAMSTHEISPHESFPSRMLRTTMDVDCPEWMDWFHGGLQFQTIHHLFPRIPRTSLRKVRLQVMEFCKETGLEYHCYGFVKCNGLVLGNMREVARQVSILFARGKRID
ncbi:hypothetical protein RI367_002756 [Sorochytrium milnesiophthora]